MSRYWWNFFILVWQWSKKNVVSFLRWSSFCCWIRIFLSL